jgi:hypothetical protein
MPWKNKINEILEKDKDYFKEAFKQQKELSLLDISEGKRSLKKQLKMNLFFEQLDQIDFLNNETLDLKIKDCKFMYGGMHFEYIYSRLQKEIPSFECSYEDFLIIMNMGLFLDVLRNLFQDFVRRD